MDDQAVRTLEQARGLLDPTLSHRTMPLDHGTSPLHDPGRHGVAPRPV